MGMMEHSPTTIAPLLLRNLLTSIFVYADKSLFTLSEKYRLLQLIRYILVTCFLLFLRLLPSLVPSSILDSSPGDRLNYDPYAKPHENDSYVSVVQNNISNSGGSGVGGVNDSGIARALSQLLSIVNDIPVSSRKYEVVRSLAEKIIEENNREGVEVLREVNRSVLSAAFTRTLGQLEAVVLEKESERGGGGGDETGLGTVGPGEHNRFSRVLKAVGDVGGWRRKGRGREVNRSAEKLAAELLWLAQKMAGCDCGDEAVCRWAAAGRLGWLALTAEPRVQGSLVKVSGNASFTTGIQFTTQPSRCFFF